MNLYKNLQQSTFGEPLKNGEIIEWKYEQSFKIFRNDN